MNDGVRHSAGFVCGIGYSSRTGRRDASAHIAGSEEGGRGGRAALSEPAPWASGFAALPHPTDERPARA